MRWASDPAFRRLSYEIAFSEYAMALGYEMAKLDPEIPADDLLYEVRSSMKSGHRLTGSRSPQRLFTDSASRVYRRADRAVLLRPSEPDRHTLSERVEASLWVCAFLSNHGGRGSVSSGHAGEELLMLTQDPLALD